MQTAPCYTFLHTPALKRLTLARMQIPAHCQNEVVQYLHHYFSSITSSSPTTLTPPKFADSQSLRFSLFIYNTLPIISISSSKVLAPKIVGLSLLGTKFHFTKESCTAFESLKALEYLHLPVDGKSSSNDSEPFNRKTRDLLINHFNRIETLREIHIHSDEMSVPLNRQWLPRSVTKLTLNVLGLRKTPNIKEDLFASVSELTIICSPNRKPPVVPLPFSNLQLLNIHRVENQTGSIKRCYEAIHRLIHSNPNIRKLYCRHIHPMDMSVIISGSRNSVFQQRVEEIHLDSHIRFRLSKVADPFYQPEANEYNANNSPSGSDSDGDYRKPKSPNRQSVNNGTSNDNFYDDKLTDDDDDDFDAMNGILWFLNVDSLSAIFQELHGFTNLKHLTLPVLESSIIYGDISKMAMRNPSVKHLTLVYRTQIYEQYIKSREKGLNYVNKFFTNKTSTSGDRSSLSSIDGVSSFQNISPTLIPNQMSIPPINAPFTSINNPNRSIMTGNASLSPNTNSKPMLSPPTPLNNNKATSNAPNSFRDYRTLFSLLNPEVQPCQKRDFKPADHVAFYLTNLDTWRNSIIE